MQMKRRCVLLCVAVCLMPACAVYERWPGGSRSEANLPPAPIVREPATPEAPDSVPMKPEVIDEVAQPTGPAGFLLDEAARQRRAGDLSAAAQSVERAMRIEPGNPWLSLELASIRLDQGNPAQAELLAQRALVQAGGDRRLRARCWTLTAAAREAVGDAAGAAAALDKASE